MKLFILLLSIALSQASTLPEAHNHCEEKDHNNIIVVQCLAPYLEFDKVEDFKNAKHDACTVEKEIQECVKENGGLCADQSREFYGIVGLFEQACENTEDGDTLWAFGKSLEEMNSEIEHKLEHDFSECLEEAALDFFDFAKLLFHEHDDDHDFELDPSKFIESTYVCAVASIADSLHLNIMSLDRLIKAFIHEAHIELEDIEICKSKLHLPAKLCEGVDKCFKDEDHNDDIALKCFDSFDHEVTDYTIFKGTEKSTELYNTIKTCIHNEGDFCDHQSKLGPALLSVFKHVAEHGDDGDTWWDLLNKIEHVTEGDESKFENTFVGCLNETNAHYLSPTHLTMGSLNNMDHLNKYLGGIYVCIVASMADTFHVNYQAVGRIANVFIEELGFKSDGIDFCDHHMHLPTTLCAAA